MKKRILGVLQLLFGIGILAFFIYRMDKKGKLDEFVMALKTGAENWPLLCLACLCFLGCLFLCNIRWIILLRAQNISFSMLKAFKLFFIGHFFSCVLPGATSGDFLKAYYVALEAPNRRTEAVSTIFIDRIIGLVALIALSATMMLTHLEFFLRTPETKFALILNVVLLGGVIAGSLLVFQKNFLEKIPWFRRLEEKPVGRIITRVHQAFHVCISSWSVLFKTLGLSLANHLLFIVSAVLSGRALGISLTPMEYLTVFPIINAVSALPLTPGGIGVRDFAAKFLLAPLGVPESLSIPLTIIVYLITLFWSLVGGIVYMAHVLQSGGTPTPDSDTPT